MFSRMTRGEKISKVVIIVLMVAFSALIILPFMNIIAISLSDRTAILSGKVTFLPVDFNLRAYEIILEDDSFLLSYRNTFIIVIAGTALSVVLTIIAGFVISRRDLPGVKVFTFLITLTMWFSGGMIPLFLVVKSIGMYDTLWAMFVPTAISAFNVIIMRNFIDSLPASLEESAVIDGANDIVVLTRIIVPLSSAPIATVTLWIAVGLWNSYMPAILYLQTPDLYPMQLLLRDIVFNSTMMAEGGLNDGTVEAISESIKYSAIIVTALPVMMMYPFLQKYFIKGVLLGAVKG